MYIYIYICIHIYISHAVNPGAKGALSGRRNRSQAPPIRPISLLILLDSNFPGNPLWT